MPLMCKEIINMIVEGKNGIKGNMGKEYEVLKDCFDISIPVMRLKTGILMLLDKEGYILGVSNTDYEKIIGCRIGQEFLTDIKSYKISKKVINNKSNYYVAWALKMTLSEKTTEYIFFLLAPQNEEKNYDSKIKDILTDCSNQLKKVITVINKYLSNTVFPLHCLDFIDEGICICDKYGHLVYFNKPTIKIMGNKVKDVLNKKMEDYCDIKPLLYQVMESKRRIIDAEYNFKFNGKTIHMISSGYPVFNGNGEIIGAIDIFRRIERSRKLANVIAGYNASYRFEDIIGKSKKIKETIELAKSFSHSEENILINGESGTGKELFAQSIHNNGYRKNNPFISINCANLPTELIESELFGYDEGAFTGARSGGKPGKFELANGGTLFLDEIGEMQYHLQAKLLRAIETKNIIRVGGSKPIKIDVRIIAATNKDLKAMIKKGQFRQDLYYRLKVLTLDIPPLNQRGEDILELADYFLKRIGLMYQKKIIGFESDAKSILMSYPWPGNVRELENLISRVVFICDSYYITKEHLVKAGLEEAVINKNMQIPNKKELKKINKKIILETLELTGGNKKKAAELLGISRQTVYRMLK